MLITQRRSTTGRSVAGLCRGSRSRKHPQLINQGVPHDHTTKAAHNAAAATNAAFSLVAATVAAALGQTSTVAEEFIADTTVGIECAAGKAQELLSGGFAAAVKKVAGLTVDGYQQAVKSQLDLSLLLADVVKVGWISELTRRNATAVAELVAVYAGATHDLLK